MSKTEEEIEKLMDIISDAGFNADDDYSGRSMFGDTCISFDFEGSEINVVLDLMNACESDEDRAFITAALKRSQTDDLGRGGVIYFPAFKTGSYETV